MKFCNVCNTPKSRMEFYRDNKKRDGLFGTCKECARVRSQRRYQRLKPIQVARASRWNIRHPERYKDIQLRLHYGITLAMYNDIAAKQDGVCAICQRTDKRALSVDHCHETGQVRGLLCGPCNRALGLLEDKLESVDRIALYLKNQLPSQIQTREAAAAAALSGHQYRAGNKASQGLLFAL